MTDNTARAVIFDFDGVLVNSEVIALRELQRCLLDIGLKIEHDDMVGQFLGKSFETIAAFAQDEVGDVNTAEFRSLWYDRLFAGYRDELTVMPQAFDLCRKLQEIDVAFCIASGGSHRRLGFALQTSGLEPLFDDRAFSADSVARGKPEPDVFLYAADKLGVAPRNCLVVEDAIAGVQAAGKARMKAIGFVGGGHLDRCRTEHAQRLRSAGATSTITSLLEVLNHIE